MFRKPGPPGEYYGYVEIDGVTYKVEARAMGKLKEWRMLGTVKRHLKADQQSLFGEPAARIRNGSRPGLNPPADQVRILTGSAVGSPPDPDFNDELPENL
jgi:hypothetical protein